VEVVTRAQRRAKSTGGLYQRASDGMWCASIELPSADPNKRRRKVIVRAKKADALAELRKARQAFERTGDLPTASTTVAQWCDLWWTRYGMTRLKVSTRDTYRSKIEQYIKPSIGRVPLDRLNLEHIYRMHAYVTDTLGISAASALAAHRVLSVIVTDAEKEGRVSRNVVKLADKPRVGKAKKVYLDNAQARDLLISVKDDPDLAARWVVALLTGARQGERLGLTIDMLDFEGRALTKAWQLRRIPFEHGCGELTADGWPCGRKRGGNCPDRRLDVPADQEVVHVEGGLYLTRPKSSASWATIPMVDLLHDILKAYIDTHPPGAHGLIFTRPGPDGVGRPIDPAIDAAEWDASLRAAGLPDVDGHSARHTCNTVLAELGVPVDVRQAILGHASKAVNEAVYTHTSDVRVVDAMRQLSSALDYRG
jgi:integrase